MTVSKRSIFYLTFACKCMVVLPRQARDKRRENSRKTTVFAGASLGPHSSGYGEVYASNRCHLTQPSGSVYAYGACSDTDSLNATVDITYLHTSTTPRMIHPSTEPPSI